MALTDENGGNNMVMPVAPMYGGGNGGGFGGWGDGGWWIILLFILLCNGGWGNGFGMGGYAADGAVLYPWMNQSNQINGGFRDQMINDNVTAIRDGIAALQTQLCNCCGDTQMAIANLGANIEQGANARQMANMQTMFGIQSSLQNCCCENRAGLADLKYTVATENCADRAASYQNTRDIIDSQTRGTQAILDKLCALELDGVKGQLAQAERDNVALQNQLNMAALRESQTAQNAFIQQGFSNEVDALYNRLNNCPVPSTPVYGRTPIFTCQNNGCGCGCGVA